MEFLAIIISTIFVNNIVLTQFLGICPFLGVSTRSSTAIGMGSAVVFVMVLSTTVTYIVNQSVLQPMGLGYLQTLVYILLIAVLVQMVELIMKKVSPALYQALGVYLPLITTNCTILGVAILVIQKNLNLVQSVIYALGNSLGFTLALLIFASLREQLELVNIPKGMRGVPVALVVAGLLSMAFMGFSGIIR